MNRIWAVRFTIVVLSICLMGLVLGSSRLLTFSRSDVLRSSTPSSVYLNKVAEVPFKSDRPGGTDLTAIAWSPTAQKVAIAFDWGHQIAVFDTSNWHEISRIKRRTLDPHNIVAFLSDSEIVAAPSENTLDGPPLSLYDSDTGRLIGEIPRPPNFVRHTTTDVVITGSRKFIVTREGLHDTALFEARTGRFVGPLATPSNTSTGVVAGGPGDKVAADAVHFGAGASSNVRKAIYLIDTSTNTVEKTISEGHIPDVGAIAWAPDGRLIASGASMMGTRSPKDNVNRDPDPIRVWDVSTGALVASFVAFAEPVRGISWHPSSMFFATNSAIDREERGAAIRLWSVAQRKMIFEHKTSRPPLVMSFDPRMGRLAIGLDSTLQVFEVLGVR